MCQGVWFPSRNLNPVFPYYEGVLSPRRIILCNTFVIIVYVSGSPPLYINEHYSSSHFASKYRHKMSAGTFKDQTVYTYVKELKYKNMLESSIRYRKSTVVLPSA
jgi:hypothetical protein